MKGGGDVLGSLALARARSETGSLVARILGALAPEPALALLALWSC